MVKENWIVEKFTPYEEHKHKYKKALVSRKTKYQRVQIVDTFSFGRCLLLDGEVQSSELDEFIYHEAMIHPAMISHPNPENVLVLGGGEGATIREILKYKSVKKVVMVDLDKEVVDFCKEYLYTWHKGAFNDKRLELIHDDARKYISETNEKFDVIVEDLCCPIKGGPAYLLYTLQFYRMLVKRLKNNGIFVMQAGSGGLLQIELFSTLQKTLGKIFSIIKPYCVYVPSFDVPWAYIIASNKHDTEKISGKQIDLRINKRLKNPLRYYDGRTHEGLFKLPKYIRDIFRKEKKIITDYRPILFFK